MSTLPDRSDAEGPGAGLLQAFLREHRSPCPVCHCDLNGLRKAECPECGSPLALTIGSPEPRQGGWLLGVIACAMALGFDSVVAAVFVVSLLMFRPRNGELAPFLVTGAMILLAGTSGLLLRAVIRRRRTWLRQTYRAQWTLGCAWFCGMGIAHVLAGVGILAIAMLVK